MKINSVQNIQSKPTNFAGKLILPETLSPLGVRFMEKCGEKVSKLLEPLPYDLFLVEHKGFKKGSECIMMAYKKGEEPSREVVFELEETLGEFNRETEVDRVRIFINKLFSSDTRVEIKDIVKPQQVKPYVPRKIGKVQKPYTKRNGY